MKVHEHLVHYFIRVCGVRGKIRSLSPIRSSKNEFINYHINIEDDNAINRHPINQPIISLTRFSLSSTRFNFNQSRPVINNINQSRYPFFFSHQIKRML